jgi:hypothetical protein
MYFFKENKNKTKKNHFFYLFPSNISNLAGLKHSCCQQQLCIGPAEFEKKNILFFIFFPPCNISIPLRLQHSRRRRRLCVGPVELVKKIKKCFFFFFFSLKHFNPIKAAA